MDVDEDSASEVITTVEDTNDGSLRSNAADLCSDEAELVDADLSENSAVKTEPDVSENRMNSVNEESQTCVLTESTVPMEIGCSSPASLIPTEISVADDPLSDSEVEDESMAENGASGVKLGDIVGKGDKSEKFRTVEQLRTRFNIKGEDVRIFKCPFAGCPFSHTRVTETVKHGEKAHQIQISEEQLMSSAPSCPACGDKIRCGIQLWDHVSKCKGIRRNHSGKRKSVKKQEVSVVKKEVSAETDHTLVYPCTVCGRALYSEDRHKHHMKSIHGSEECEPIEPQAVDEVGMYSPKCIICEQKFDIWTMVYSHVSEVHGGYDQPAKKKQKLRFGYPCSSCPQVQKTMGGLKRHTQHFHKRQLTAQEAVGKLTEAKSLLPSCKRCGKKFQRWDHWRLHQPTCAKSSSTGKQIAKSKPAALKLTMKEEKYSHKKQETNGLCYPCSSCKRVLIVVNGLRKHTAGYHRREPTKEELIGQPLENITIPSPHCDVCGIKFAKWYNFYTHQPTCKDSAGVAASDFLYCLQCRKRFPTADSLARHAKMFHTPNHSTADEGQLMFPCHICGRVLTNQGRAERHMLLIHQSRESIAGKTFGGSTDPRCWKCMQSFKTWSGLYKHTPFCKGGKGTVSGGEQQPKLEFSTTVFAKVAYPCPHCDRVLYNPSSASLHLKNIHNVKWSEKPISPVPADQCPQGEPKCLLCSETFKEWKDLYKHMRHKHNDDHAAINSQVAKVEVMHYQCNLCERVLTTVDGVNYHLRDIHNTDVQQNPINPKPASQIKAGPPHCKQCSITFDKWKRLYNHLREEHEDSLSIYPNVTVRVLQDKSQGQKKVNGKKSKCEQCLIIYQTEEQLQRHNQLHHPDANKMTEKGNMEHVLEFVYPCKICGRVLSEMGSLESHMKSVHQVKGSNVVLEGVPRHEVVEPEPTCKECGRVFETWNALYRHIKKDGWGPENHNVDKSKFTCSTCKLSFKDEKNLNRHNLLNHNLKSHVPVHQSSLKRKRISKKLSPGVNGGRYNPPIACLLCDKMFHYEDFWYRHLKSSHRISNSRRKEMKSNLKKERGRLHSGSSDVKPKSFSRDLECSEGEQQNSVESGDMKATPKCGICDKKFRYKIQLKQHILKAHKEMDDSDNESSFVNKHTDNSDNDAEVNHRTLRMDCTDSSSSDGSLIEKAQSYQIFSSESSSSDDDGDLTAPPAKKSRHSAPCVSNAISPVQKRSSNKHFSSETPQPQRKLDSGDSGDLDELIPERDKLELDAEFATTSTGLDISEDVSIGDDKYMPHIDVNVQGDVDATSFDGHGNQAQLKARSSTAHSKEHFHIPERENPIPPVAVLKPFSDTHEHVPETQLSHTTILSSSPDSRQSSSISNDTGAGYNTQIQLNIRSGAAPQTIREYMQVPSSSPLNIQDVPNTLDAAYKQPEDSTILQAVPASYRNLKEGMQSGSTQLQTKSASYPVFVVNSQDYIVPCKLGSSFSYRRLTFTAQHGQIYWYFTQWYLNLAKCKWRVIALLPGPVTFVSQMEKFVRWCLSNRLSTLPFGSNKVPRLCEIEWEDSPKFVLLTSYDTPKYTTICCLCGHVVSSVESLSSHATENHSKCTLCNKVVTPGIQHTCGGNSPTKVGFINLSTPSSKYCSPVECEPRGVRTTATSQHITELRKMVSHNNEAASSRSKRPNVSSSEGSPSSHPICAPRSVPTIEKSEETSTTKSALLNTPITSASASKKIAATFAKSADKILHALVRNLTPTTPGTKAVLDELLSHYTIDSYQCQRCLSSFSLQTQYEHHIKTSHKKCTQCEEMFENRELRSDHIAEVHQKHICMACEFTCDHEDDITDHVMTDHVDASTGKFKCLQCADQLIDPETITEHLEQDDAEMSSSCNICSKTLPEESEEATAHFLGHMITLCSLACLQCDALFPDAWSLRKHMVKHAHSFCMHCLISPAKASCTKCFLNCDVDPYVKQKAMKMRPRTGCQVCDEQTDGHRELREHCDAMHANFSHQCSTCGQRLESSSQLEEHSVIHTDTQAYYYCVRCLMVSRAMLYEEEVDEGRVVYISQICTHCKDGKSWDLSPPPEYVKIAGNGKMYRFPRSVLTEYYAESQSESQ